MDKKPFIIINPHSGKGRRDALEDRIHSRCEREGLEPVVEITRHARHATELARLAAARGFTRVFAVGGDGTINETAQGLVHSGVAMGIIPTGSGNGLARHLGVPMALDRALDLLTAHRPVAIDALRINGRYSFNVSGVGFDGLVAGLFGLDGQRGLLGYVKIILKEYVRFPEFRVTGEVAERPIDVPAFVAAFANASQFGNGAIVAPQASVRDGLLELCLIRKPGWAQAVSLVTQMMTGRLDRSPLVEIERVPSCRIVLEQPVAWHLDGEACPPADRFEVVVAPACLTMLVPKTSRPL